MKRFFYYFAAIVAGAMLALACEPEAQPETPGNEDNGGQNTTVEVTSVTLNEETVALEVEDVFTIVATVLPENATNKAVTYESKNPEVATVDSYGLVTAVAEGTAVIEVTAGGKTAQLTVTVTVPEVVETSFSEVLENYEEVSEGVYYAELPLGDGYSFAGTFDFKDFFVNLPADATFALAPVEQQNAEVAEYYESLTGNLAADGTWTRNERFANDLNVGEDNSANGVRVLVSAGGQTLYTINFYIVDPVVGLEMLEVGGHPCLKSPLTELANANNWHYNGPEIELGNENNWQFFALKHGAENDINLVELLNDPTNFMVHTGADLFNVWPTLSVSGTNGEELFYNDATNGVIAYSPYSKELVKHSKGLFWQQQWTVYMNCANWQLPEAERPVPALGSIAEGAAINGTMDFVGPEAAEVFKNEVGLYLDADGHIKTTENYKGAGARISPQLHFEYDYGSVCVSSRYMAMIFVNRRWAAPEEIADVVYPFTDGSNEVPAQ